MITNIAGLIYTGEHNDRLGELTRMRSVAAMPVMGRYRIIDFILSGMVNSGIRNIGVILQKNYRSLLDQIGSGRDWDLHGKRNGLSLLPPFSEQDGYYEGLLDALKNNLNFLRRSKERYIAVSDGHVLCSIAFDEVLTQHERSGADMTLVYTRDRDARRNGGGRYLDVDADHRVRQMEINPTLPHFENTYIGTFIIRREMLIDLVDRASAKDYHHFTRELLLRLIADGSLRIFGYEMPTKVWMVDSVETYYNANMSALNEEIRARLFRKDRPIWTKLRDEMPARYAPGAHVKNSLVADGCVIEGDVEDSVIFRGVTVQPGAKVKGCIVMQDAIICRNAEIENCIFDKQTTVREGTRLIGPRSYPIVVAKNLTI